MVKAVSDATVGTVIVLVHVALADRRSRIARAGDPDGATGGAGLLRRASERHRRPVSPPAAPADRRITN